MTKRKKKLLKKKVVLKNKNTNIPNSITITVAGAAGEGINTTESLLSLMAATAGYYVYTCQEYMSRVRGGSNSVDIRISTTPIIAKKSTIDILMPTSEKATEHCASRLSKQSYVVNATISESLKGKVQHLIYDTKQIAKDKGVFQNIIFTGLVAGMLGIDKTIVDKTISQVFAKKGNEVVNINLSAIQSAYEDGKQLLSNHPILETITTEKKVHDSKTMLISGNQALAYGMIAGGVNFVAAYPMSPSTGLFTTIAEESDKYGILIDQAEDEIAAINMAIGSWYAGGKALANSSGGGFALMQEGVSLAAMMESPLVIHIAMRPGPATGLPTRTEQGDLLFALYSGHGEFPRVIYAPGTAQEAFTLGALAFTNADKLQIPVFVLTDQHFLESNTITHLSTKGMQISNEIVSTTPEYKRYIITKSGISPRGIPGHGTGIVFTDSDEHTEEGLITESLAVRKEMVEKRFRKIQGLIDVEPTIYNSKNNTKTKKAIVSWGSNYGPVQEAVEQFSNNPGQKTTKKGIDHIHFSQVYPLPKSSLKLLQKYKEIFVLENNATGQFGKLLHMELGIVTKPILKYDGSPFAVDEIVNELSRRL